MLCYLDNRLHILKDRKVPFLGQFDKFLVCQNEQIDHIKIGVLSAVSCNASLKAITAFDNASLP